MSGHPPTVRKGRLIASVDAEGGSQPVAVGDAAWFAWLDRAATFAFEDATGTFIAHKRESPAGGFWLARRRAGRVFSAPLGRSADLTLDRLRTVALLLADRASAASVHHRAFSQDPRAIGRSVQLRGDEWAAGVLVHKVTPPRLLTSVIARARVDRALGDAFQRPLVLVSAPAGYGKTVALTQWSHTSAPPIAWLKLNDGDNDPARFWTHFVAAADRLVPGILRELAPMVSEARQRRPERLLSALVAALMVAPDPAILILDDYQAVRDDSVIIHDGLAFLVEHLPRQLHLAIGTRADPPLPLWRWRVHGTLAEVRAADLRLTRTEVGELLARSYGLSPSPHCVDQLDARLEGWAAGLRLVAPSLPDGDERAAWAAALAGASHHTFDYLAAEVLRDLPEQLLRFLLHTCVLDRFHAPLCDAVTMSSGSASLLAELSRRNLFLIPLDEKGQWYRYHPLFADVLRQRLCDAWPELMPEIYRRASAWHQACGQVGAAVEYALAAGDDERAARLIEAHAERLLSLGRWASLRRWLGRLPDSALQTRPRLHLVHAFLLHRDGQFAAFQRSVQSAGAVRAHLEARGTRSELATFDGEFAALSAVASALEGASPSRCIPAYEHALVRLPAKHPYRRLLLLHLGIAHYLNGSMRLAGVALEELRQVSEAARDTFALAQGAAYLAQVLLAQGRVCEAISLCERVIGHLTGERGTCGTQGRCGSGGIAAALGMALFERNQLAAAAEQLENSLASADPTALALTEAHAMLAYVCAARNDPERAHEVFADAWVTLRQMGPWALQTARIGAHQARLHMLQGNLAAAAIWARAYEHRDARARAAVETYPLPREWERIVLARVYLGEGKVHEARALLVDPLATAEAAGRMRHALEALVLLVNVEVARGDITAALRHLRRALALGELEGCVRTFLDGGPAIRRLLTRLLASQARQQHDADDADDADDATRMRAGYMEALLNAYDEDASVPAHEDSHLEKADPERAPAAPAAGQSRAVKPLLEPLTDREREVLRLLAHGRSNREIARELVIAVGTVKRHVSNVLGKLGVASRTQAIARAQDLSLLAPPPVRQ